MFNKKLEDFSHIEHLNHSCPVCGTQDGAVLGALQYSLFDNSPLADNFHVTCCVQCGFVFCNTPSSQDDYDRFYQKYFYSSAYLDRKITKDEETYLAQILDDLSPYLGDKRATIFDIGCGTGRLLKTLRREGYSNLYAVDPSSCCIDQLNTYQGIRAKTGSLGSIPFDSTKADVIILSHILEHVIDLPVALQSIENKLSDDGFVYVEVPDAMRYGSIRGFSPLRFFYLQHVIHFDESHLRNLFKNREFQHVQSGNHVRVEGELVMPCVWGMFRRNKKRPDGIQPDFNLAHRIQTWFSNISLDKDNILANIVHSGMPIYVWGMGIHTQLMLAMSPLGQGNITCFIDKDEKVIGEKIRGKKICSPDALYNATEKDVVVIGAPTHAETMRKYLIEQIGFKGKVVVCGFGDVHLACPLQNQLI